MSDRLSPSEKVIAEKTVCVLLLRGESQEGEKMYAYVAVRADRLSEFMEAQQSDTFFPEDYGMVIESGTGEPSDEVKAKMTKEYGFNHEAMVDIDSSKDAYDMASNLTSIVASSPNKPSEDD